MEKVRIGNDLRVNFSVYRNGEPESFDGATNISTKIVNESYNKTIAHTYSIVDNVIQFNIDALELKQCGKCRVFISYTKVGDYTVDSPAFELVQYTEDTGGTEVIGIEIVKINISGDIGINRDGSSAYEVWESYPGNEGKTIEQYFEWLHENPTKIDLDGLNSNIDKLHFNPDTLVQLANVGDVRYSPESRTLEVKVSDTVSIQLGQEMQTRVKNDEAIQINNGHMVYINSAAGANPLAKIASTSNPDVAQKTFGMATENIPANGFGAITTEGLVRDINTSAFPEGSMLWLGTNGSVTNIEPVAPVSKISVGMVLRSNANNGVVYVKIRAIARNQKLSDVYAPTLAGGDILRWNSTTLRFETFNITSALSNKVDTSRTITAGNGLTGGGNLSADRTINIANADDSLVVAADSVKVNTNNTLTSTSTTQPLSANQGKVLNEKVVQVETDLNLVANNQDYRVLTYVTDAGTTRKQIPISARKKGMILSYFNGTELITEQFLGPSTGDVTFASSTWWSKVKEQFTSDTGINNNLNKLFIDTSGYTGGYALTGLTIGLTMYSDRMYFRIYNSSNQLIGAVRIYDLRKSHIFYVNGIFCYIDLKSVSALDYGTASLLPLAFDSKNDIRNYFDVKPISQAFYVNDFIKELYLTNPNNLSIAIKTISSTQVLIYQTTGLKPTVSVGTIDADGLVTFVAQGAYGVSGYGILSIIGLSNFISAHTEFNATNYEGVGSILSPNVSQLFYSPTIKEIIDKATIDDKMQLVNTGWKGQYDEVNMNYGWDELKFEINRDFANYSAYIHDSYDKNNITASLIDDTIFGNFSKNVKLTYLSAKEIRFTQKLDDDYASRIYRIGIEIYSKGIYNVELVYGNDNYTTRYSNQSGKNVYRQTILGSNMHSKFFWVRIYQTGIGGTTFPVDAYVGRFSVIRVDSQSDSSDIPYISIPENGRYAKNLLVNKRFYSIGDSIVGLGFWQPYLAKIKQLRYMKSATDDVTHPLGVGSTSICPKVSFTTTDRGEAYKVVDDLGNQLTNGIGQPIWFAVGQEPNQSIYYRSSYFADYYSDAEVIVINAGQNDRGNGYSYDIVGTETDTPYEGLQYVETEFAAVAKYYPNIAIYDDGTLNRVTYPPEQFTIITEKPSFCSCMAGMIKKIMTACPRAKVVGNTVTRKATAGNIEKAKAIAATYKHYCIPVADMWNNFGVNDFNYTEYYLENDIVHPNFYGARRMAEIIANVL